MCTNHDYANTQIFDSMKMPIYPAPRSRKRALFESKVPLYEVTTVMISNTIGNNFCKPLAYMS